MNVRTRTIQAMLAIALAVFCGLAFAVESVIPLQTELKVQSLGVGLRAPFGLRYHPGELFPLELYIENPGPLISAEIELSEGAPHANDFTEKTVLQANLPTGKSRHVLSARASAVSAALVLRIRSRPSAGSGAELFRASLSRLLIPLAAGGRVILSIGNPSMSAPRGPSDGYAQLDARDLPAEDWMWEGVDWVVLNDASIKNASAVARTYFKEWLIGGGRVFAGSREALAAAHAVDFLPLKADVEFEAGINWWEKNAGLTKSDILAEKNFRPVYARMKMGFGQIVFLFPGSDAADANGAEVFNRADLQRARIPADTRIQPGRSEMFTSASASESRRRNAGLWSVLGALLICATLIYAHSSKWRWESIALPFCVAALIGALLANGFPRPDLMNSHVRVLSMSQDHRAFAMEDWILLESFRTEIVTRIAPTKSVKKPVYENSVEAQSAGLVRDVDLGRASLSNITVAPDRPVVIQTKLIHASTGLRPKNGISLVLDGKKLGLLLSSTYWEDSELTERAAIWIRENQVWLLTREGEGRDFQATHFTSSKLRATLTTLSLSNTSNATAAAISQTVEACKNNYSNAVIFWRNIDSLDRSPADIEHSSPRDDALLVIRINPAEYEPPPFSLRDQIRDKQ